MKRTSSSWLLRILMILTLFSLAPLQTGRAAPSRQVVDPSNQAREMLRSMSPQERVGQLFLVAFVGSQVDEDTQIEELVTRYHIGGVVLLSSNDNFTNPDQIAQHTYWMSRDLQQAEWDSAQNPIPDPETGKLEEVHYIPLLIGVPQEGDGYPYDQILSGLTPLPNEMAIGATWNPDLSNQVGQVLGSELSALGFNLLLGPSLDVLERRYDDGREDLGTRTFGGDPYWVQEMGKAYIAGVHQGSQGKIAVIAKHFPGQGSSDRSPYVEVATVRKSLEQLQQIELPPFFAVSGSGSASPDSTADGMLVSHIRYLFQGNIRATTRPVSLDPTALKGLMSIPPLLAWQENGGLLVSDDLGSRAVRRFYDPTGQQFDPRQVAREAFLAGNDLLYVNDFVATGDPDAFTSLVKTLDFFTRKYNEDSAFAQRVDQSVLRILTLKYRMYPEFELESVLPLEEDLSKLGNIPDNDRLMFDIARSAVTLISPDIADLPDPPTNRDRLLFISDTLTRRQCTYCLDVNEVPVDALQSAVLRLYGPQAGGQVTQSRLSSYSFNDLLSLLNDSQPVSGEPPPLEGDLSHANWVVFSTLQVDLSRPASTALRRLLNERPELLRDKRVVVFAFNAPYYLDATDISKLTAYYALYSKTPASWEVAARVLFQEMDPVGASPVSIPGIGYDLIEITSPDPQQIIPLDLDLSSPEMTPTPTPEATALAGGTSTPVPTPVPTFSVGDVIPLKAGPVLDHNGRPVPDGTLVRFLFTMDGRADGTQQIEALTSMGTGIARTSYKIEREGLLDIRAESDQATGSFNLKLDISAGAGAVITAIAPTSIPSDTPTPTLTPTMTPTIVVTVVPPPPSTPDLADWFLSLLVTMISAGAVYFAGVRWVALRWGLRWGLCAVLGGLTAYCYLAVGLPGGGQWIQTSGTAGIILFTLLGVSVGVAAGFVWRSWLEQKLPRKI